MTVAAVAPALRQPFLSNAGAPLSGGFLYTYAAGTLTPKKTYSDTGLTVEISNPIVLNAAGRPQASEIDTTEVNVYLLPASYKFILKDSSGSTIWTADNVPADGTTSLDFPVIVTGGTAGAIPYFSSASALSVSALLAQYGVLVGGGASGVPASITPGTNNQILVGVTSAAPVMRSMVIADMPLLSMRLTADVSATTATLATVTDLSVTVLSSTKYHYRALLFTAGDTTGGIKFGLAGTAVVADLRFAVTAWNQASAGNALLVTEFTSTTLTTNAASATGSGLNTSIVEIEGAFSVTTGGTLLLQFAQSTGSGTSTLQKNSYVELTPSTN